MEFPSLDGGLFGINADGSGTKHLNVEEIIMPAFCVRNYLLYCGAHLNL